MRHIGALALLLLLAVPSFGATPDNDATCDIAVLPAATLLLPYFEVDLDDPNGETTLFTITNVGDVEQVAHVILWTDYGYPVLDLHIFLTGYDAQSINLYDVLAKGEIAPPLGTGFERPGSPEGDFSDDARNPLVDETTCRLLPRKLDASYRERLRRAFTTGSIPPLGTGGEGCDSVGGVHENATGWVTIDVVRSCAGTASPLDEEAFLDELLFDNVLTGDYQQVHSRQAYAQGGPLVHIRAIPEGGGATPLPRTFYGAYLSEANRGRDARQPLPSAFASRWTAGGPLETKLKIWRESDSGANQCGEWSRNGAIEVEDFVRFDSDGNAVITDHLPTLPATSLVDVSDPNKLPQMPDATSGWIYLNLGKQAWVITSMRADGRYSADADATAFGNGCSPVAERGATIAPAANANSNVSGVRNDDTCDIAVVPAATLLLPYFEVALDGGGLTTLFTVTNTSPTPRIASVTLWTDFAFPVATFAIPLAPYDMQTINLADVLRHGIIPSCDGSPSRLPADAIKRMQGAFVKGLVLECRHIGSAYQPESHAVGYATIDVASVCATLDPTRPEYYDAVIAFDNVLTGDYQQVAPFQNLGQGSPLVHIRAIPDGGTESPFATTFYSRFQSAGARDARQPLPSRFVAHWINGSAGGFKTSFNIWIDGVTGANARCRDYAQNTWQSALEFVAFDEMENAVGTTPTQPPCTCLPDLLDLRLTGRYDLDDPDSDFPRIDDAYAGWMYLNLNDAFELHGATRQAWVTTTMRAEGRYSVESDATALGNGCSPFTGESEVRQGTETIGPSPNRRAP